MQEFPINAATGRVMLTKYYITARPKEDSKELVRMAMADPLVIRMMLIFNAANPSEVSFVTGANRHRSAEEPHTGANILMVFTSVVNARGGEGGVVEYEAQLQNCSQYKTCRNDLLPPPWLHELD